MKVVFNKARGMLMVVSEITKSQNKATGNGTRQKRASNRHSRNFPSYKKLIMAMICAQSLIYQQLAWAANTQIKNKASNIPSSQRAALLKARNGTPIINIRTPNRKGLSHNTYSKFNIGNNNVILNNSVGGAKTRLAGTINGNQYLAKGSASTILNEVRSTAPSYLKGNIEIAGQKADVIVANPSGLVVNGAGFINANRATLTTGNPRIVSGALDSFDVSKGKVNFIKDKTSYALGGGRNTKKAKAENRANYVDVIARGIEVNGRIASLKSTNLVTGSHRIDYDTLSAKKKLKAKSTRPSVAIDVKDLGGIYAKSIALIGNENGLGVRNAGTLSASSYVVLDSAGKISNSGKIKTTSKSPSNIILTSKGKTNLINSDINSTGNIHINSG
ncbi:MAG: hemagglutinin, partial [Gammaproteobacteria bacterium]